MPTLNRQSPLGPDRWYDPRDLAERLKNTDVVKCSCGCSYFEQVAVQQFPKLHNVILGQAVQPAKDFSFFIFRCVKCMAIYEPQVQLAARDAARKTYEDFLDELETPVDVPKASIPEVL